MKLEGTYRIEAPRAVVWNLLNDPDALARALPGCERLTRSGDNSFDGVISIGIASIKSTYAGTVALSDIVPGESYSMQVEGQGKGGFVKGRGRIALAPVDNDEGATSMSVSGDAQVGGAIAVVGQRLLDAAARKVLKEFAAALGNEAQRRTASDVRV